MQFERRRFALWALGVILLASGSVGCAAKTYDHLIPAEDKSRDALEEALSAWEGGATDSKILASGMTIQVLDAKWRAGQKLESYEILGVESDEDGKSWFNVRLVMKKPAGEQIVRYVVIGQEPIWVYREDDYKQATGM
jgi:hypothetical protein